jgi:hypothetical protein
MNYDILSLLEQHETNGTYLADKIISERLHLPLLDVQRALDDLEDLELVTVLKAFGPSYDAMITPRGRRALRESAEETPVPARRIGF